MRKVAVFFGGKSSENEISVLTGVFVMNVLDKEKFSVLPVYIHTDGEMYTSPEMTELSTFQKGKFNFQKIIFHRRTAYVLDIKRGKVKRLAQVDVALNCCHGGLGEGGGVSALTEWNGIPLASPDMTSSAIFMDKSVAKTVLRGLNIPTLDYVRVNEQDYEKRGAFLLKHIGARLKYPVVVKPAHLGSSIGIALAHDETEVKKAVENAFRLDDRVIIEKYLDGKKDVNCAVYSSDGEIYVSEPEEAFSGGIYTFEEKYLKQKHFDKRGQTAQKTIPNGELRDKIRAYAKTVYKRMNLRGVVRMDFLVSGAKAYLCEVNTVPGSLAYYLFCERITDARTFFSVLLEDALRAKPAKDIVETGILHKPLGNYK